MKDEAIERILEEGRKAERNTCFAFLRYEFGRLTEKYQRLFEEHQTVTMGQNFSTANSVEGANELHRKIFGLVEVCRDNTLIKLPFIEKETYIRGFHEGRNEILRSVRNAMNGSLEELRKISEEEI